MAYGELETYADNGSIIIDQPGRRTEYGFRTVSIQDSDFAFEVNGPPGSRLPDLRVTKAGIKFETVRSGTYGQAPTLEAAIGPLQDLMTVYTTSVPRVLAGDAWGPSNECSEIRILGVTSVNGQPTIMLEIDLIEGGPASLWLDQATLLIRRMQHQSPRGDTFVTVTFTRLDAR